MTGKKTDKKSTVHSVIVLFGLTLMFLSVTFLPSFWLFALSVVLTSPLWFALAGGFIAQLAIRRMLRHPERFEAMIGYDENDEPTSVKFLRNVKR